MPSGGARLRIDPNRQKTSADALASVRSMLLDNEKLSISASTPGIITVATPNVWSLLLDVKLDKLVLGDIERFNPDYAIIAAQGAREKSLDNLHAKSLVSWYSELGLCARNAPGLADRRRLGAGSSDQAQSFAGQPQHRADQHSRASRSGVECVRRQPTRRLEQPLD